MLSIALCDCSVNTDNHSLFYISVSKTKFSFIQPKMYILSKFLLVVILCCKSSAISKKARHTQPESKKYCLCF